MIVQQLTQIQDRYGYLPRESLVALAKRLAVPLYRIEEVVSFFPHYRKSPPPEVEIHVCRDMSCQLRGSSKLIAELETELAAERATGRAAVCGVSCLGRCDRAPAVRVYHNRAESNHDGEHFPHAYYARSGADISAAAKSLLAGSGHPDPKPDRDSDLPDASATWKINVYAGKPREQRYRALLQLIEAMKESVASGETKRNQIIQTALRDSVLLGMGGAGGQAFRKWSDVRDAQLERKKAYVVCNADESEPGTFKDRELLLRTPYLVVEGVILAGLVVGATQGYIYVRHEYEECIEELRKEIEWAKKQGLCGQNVKETGVAMEVEVFVSPGGYICGEQTALIQAIEDKRAEPRNKPPEPMTNGLWDMPTVVNNVETLAWVPAIILGGNSESKPSIDPAATARLKSDELGKKPPDPDLSWYGKQGRPFGELAAKILLGDRSWESRHGKAPRFPGLRLFSISGDVERPGVYEVENGITVQELLDTAGGIRKGTRLKAIAFSGPSAGFTPVLLPKSRWPKKLQGSLTQLSILDLQIHLNFFRNYFTGLQLGAGIVVYADDANLVEQAVACQTFFQQESCGKCVPCRLGSKKLLEITKDLEDGFLTAGDLAEQSAKRLLVQELKFAMENTSICSLGASAPNPLLSLLKDFPEEVEPYVKRPVEVVQP